MYTILSRSSGSIEVPIQSGSAVQIGELELLLEGHAFPRRDLRGAGAIGFHERGLQDPVALEPMADRIKARRPVTDLHKWTDVRHWPSIEVPNRVAKAILDRLDG